MSLNKSLNGFENELLIFRVLNDLGIKIYRLNNTYLKCIIGKYMFDIHINKIDNLPKIICQETNAINSFKGDMDLFDYNNDLIVTAEKTNFAGKNNIFLFQISKVTLKNNFKLYDYKESTLLQLFCYYEKTKDYIFVFINL